ncbi:hypothetical protein [Acidimangrovimonas pyrenivorans]|uniref:Uncharacterized protein n=1 Tax=Acidimangrovimonas pyrenivorans TaxID=2030798 RepID=A0ABV7AHR5_9RHOB
MKEAPRQPLFLARQSYRRRRLMDAARLLPILGACLFLLPILWAPQPGEAPRSTAHDGIYLFIAWAGLILAAVPMARALAPEAEGAGLPETGPAAGPVAGPPPTLAEPGLSDPGPSDPGLSNPGAGQEPRG